MEEIKPFSPSDALANKKNVIHEGIIQIINEFLSTRYSNGQQVTIKQQEVASTFVKRYPDFTTKKLYDEHHLDFEYLYEKQGWSVKYDKPAYNESYDPFWVFKPNSK